MIAILAETSTVSPQIPALNNTIPNKQWIVELLGKVIEKEEAQVRAQAESINSRNRPGNALAMILAEKQKERELQEEEKKVKTPFVLVRQFPGKI